MQAPASPPPPRAHPQGSSPTASRIASGRPVPLPLDLAAEERSAVSSDNAISAASSYNSSPATGSSSLISPEPQLDSPTTPEASASAQNAASADAGDGGKSQGPWSGQEAASSTPGPSLPASPPAARPSTTTFPSPSAGHTARRPSNKLPSSASTNSLGGRSVLGYTVSSRRTGGAASTTPLPATAGAGAGAALQSGSTSSSRFLLTVVPPEHLPHDPPHPRANPQCSGYGPPEHFRRGTLVPLYPTLSSQLAAIAREYGLPSSGGLVLYLLSTNDPATQQPFPQAAAFAGEGGPRISNAAWNLLWSQLFAEEEGEREMLRFEQQQREQGLLDSEELSEDEGYRPPPVPPIPSEHAATRQREVSAETSTGSDEHDRASQASEAGLGRDGPAGDGRPTPLDNRASAIARAGLGRGPPPSAASSPAAGPKRFSSFPSTSQAGLERRSSRHSLRSVSQRTATHHASGYGHATAPPSARTASFGSSRFASGAGSLFSPSLAGASTSCLPGYGASVVVGKVEFDIHAASRQGKWYEGWLASASQPVSQSASLLAKAPHAPDQPPVAPCEKGSDVARVPADGALPHNGDMLMGTGPTAGTGLDVPGETSPARSESTPLAETVPLPSGLSDGDSSMVDKLANLTASAEPSPELHPGDTSFGTLPPPSHAPSSLPSRPASVASTLMEDEESSASEPGLGFVDDQQSVDDGYAPLADDDERATKPTASDAGSDDSRYGRATEEGGDAASINGDPLADVFQSDAATWRSIADDESQPRIDERDAIETTGLGISGARHVSEIEASAAPGVLERREADESLDEQGLPPPQDDVRDVMSMLSSTPTTATHPINLASPIRLATSDAAAADTGVFPPAPQPEVARGRENVDEDRTSPFLPSQSAQTSISTVNFSVRPPSTIASMSPEYVAARKQRQGWTNVPAVVDPSMSSSSSLSSIAGLASDSARSSSSTGLMENLDDLERALADLSPRASARSRMPAVFSPATILQEADARQVEEPRPSFPPRTSSREQSEEGEVPAAANPAAPAPPPSLLASRPAFRYRALASNSDTAGDAFGQPLSQDVTDVSPTATATPAAPSEPVRIPRSSSLHKPEGRVEPQPHLIALPPSPMPASVATLAHTPEALEETLPALPAASPSWPAAPPLPPSPSPPAMPFANFVPRQSVPPPPPPSTEEFHPTQSRSPAARKGGFKWGSRNKSIDAGKANAAPAADGPSSAGDDPSSSSGAKSPLGSFFGKFGGKGDRKGFFRRGDSTSPEPPVPAPAADVAPELPPRQPSLDVESEHLIPGFGRPRRPSVSAGSQPQPRDLSQDALPLLPSLEENAAPALPPLADLTHMQQRDELFASVSPASPAAPAADQPSGGSPVAGSNVSLAVSPPPATASAQPDDPSASSTAVSDAEPSSPAPHPRASSSFGSPSQRASSSSAASASTVLSPSEPAFALSSALGPSSSSVSDAPGTPRVSAAQPPSPTSAATAAAAPPTPRYPASAPVTPAAWQLGGTLGSPGAASAYGLSPPATTGPATGARAGTSSARGRARLSADIDQLLSQMRDIDFALEDPTPAPEPALDAAAAVAAVPVMPAAPSAPQDQQEQEQEQEGEQAPDDGAPPFSAATDPPPTATPTLIEPEQDTSLAYGGGEIGSPTASRPLSFALAGAGAGAGLLGAPSGGEDEVLRPLSADLRAIGSVMTLGSPPTSPTQLRPGERDVLDVLASPTRA